MSRSLDKPPAPPNWVDHALLAAVAGLTSLWCLTAGSRVGATFDEPFYIESGLHFWRHADPGPLLAAGTMPLSAEFQALPLYAIERLRGVHWVWPESVGTMLTVARAATLVFWCVLLMYVMRLGRALGGRYGGRLALAIVALEPSFLAHAGLATTDVPFAACLLAFAFHFRDGRDRPWIRRVGLPAVLFALALLAKASALTFGPIVTIAVEAERAMAARRLGQGRRLPRPADLVPFARDAGLVFVLGVALAVLLCGTGGGPSFQGTLARLPPGNWLRPALAWFGSLPLFPNGLYALWFQVDHALTGQATYVAGIEAARWLWFYVPALLAFKLPIPVLIVAGAAALLPRPRLGGLAGLVGIVITLMAVVRVQTGIRFLLPLLAPLLAMAAARVARAGASYAGHRRRLLAGAAAALVVWLAAGDLRAWPDTLRFTNELAGDTREGHRFVSDSNYDWGQGLPELAAWQAARGVSLAVWYFGTDPRFPWLVRYDPRRDGIESPILSGRYLAVSASLMYGGYLTSEGPGRQLRDRLRFSRPIARTTTFFIFDLAAPKL